MHPNKILMVTPQGFDIKYAINVHMKNTEGNLHQVDSEKALCQWKELKNTYESLGFEVLLKEGDSNFPDMVFCANTSFSFLDSENKPSVILSQMHDLQRKGETEAIEKWFLSQDIKVYRLDTSSDFEGSGDALWSYEAQEIFCGYGFRTQPSICSQIEKITHKKTYAIHLINENFYHLDTCLSILNKDTAVYVPGAFSTDGLELIRSKFNTLIEASENEAVDYLAANCHCPDGKNVIFQKGAENLCNQLRQHSFNAIEVDTSEFIKSGGSIFCMKQQLF